MMITIEFIKFFQGLLLKYEKKMHTEIFNDDLLKTQIIKPKAQMTSLNDDLGKVKYILSKEYL